jgi:cytoskeletal protein CcmA (bactofilin family)
MADSYKINYYGSNGNANMQLTVGQALVPGTSTTTPTAQTTEAQLSKSIILGGRNYTDTTSAVNGYGKALNQNFMRLTESFADTYTSHSNTTNYPAYVAGQLVFETTPPNVSIPANTLYMFTSSGNYATANKVQILSNVNPPHKIAWGSNSPNVESNVAIVSQDGNVVIAVNGTPNVVTIQSSGNSNSGNITFNIGTQFQYTYTNGGIGNLTVDRYYAPQSGNGTSQFYGNAHGLEHIWGPNVDDFVPLANLALEVSNAAQPNITSVGTLTGLTVSGNTTSGNLSVTKQFTGNTANLDKLTMSNVITSTLTGSAPFIVASNSIVSNLNSELLNGYAPSKLVVADTVVVRDTNGGLTANGITANTVAGTLTTAAQPNITSVGTLDGLTVGGAGIDGTIIAGNQPYITDLGNVTFSGNITIDGVIKGTVEGNATSTVTGGNATFSSQVEAPTGNFTTTVQSPSANITNVFVTTGNITTVNSTTGNITTVNSTTVNATTVQATTMTTGGSGTAGTITGTWTLSSGSKLQSTYADLAEYYTSELDVLPGTVVEFGGTEEVQMCDTRNSTRVAGIVSTDPAYVMNEKTGQTKPRILVALIGRVPCKVYGTCSKGDMMVAAGGGYAMANNNPAIGSVIGKALEDKTTTGIGTIEVVVGRL